MIESITIKGFRGFQTQQTLNLAIPNSKRGSGLTILVGPNGGGKSTIIECFRKLSVRNYASFSEGKRNKIAGDRVSIKLTFNGIQGELKTVLSGGSETEWVAENRAIFPEIYLIPSRRVFYPYFDQGNMNRQTYSENIADFDIRNHSIDNFSYRIFNALEKYDAFSKYFNEIYGETWIGRLTKMMQGNIL